MRVHLLIAVLINAAANASDPPAIFKPTTVAGGGDGAVWVLDKNWPSSTPSAIEAAGDRGITYGAHYGQVTGVQVDRIGRVWVLHRTPFRIFGPTSFNSKNVVQYDAPIAGHTIVRYPTENATHVDMKAGENLFYMPHMITIDPRGNVWVVDVGLHQVLKFDPGNLQAPALSLGVALAPGSDDRHFCKPTDVAVAGDGSTFVSDGYCNSRVVQFDVAGRFVRSIGSGAGSEPGRFRLPHGLAWDEGTAELFVADRLNLRVQVFDREGRYKREYRVGFPTFGVTVRAGRLYVATVAPVRQVRVLDAATGRPLANITTPHRGLRGGSMPHDVAVSDSGAVFVAESRLNRLLKYVPASPIASR